MTHIPSRFGVRSPPPKRLALVPAPAPAIARKELVCIFCHLPGLALKDCRRLNHKCLACGASDHQHHDCPKANNFTSRGPTPQQAPTRTQPRVTLPTQQEMFLRIRGKMPQQGRPVKRWGRAYNLTLKESKMANGVIIGTILLQSIHAHVLFNFGATHSFISANFIARHHIHCDDMVHPWNRTMRGRIVVCSKEYRKSPIVICGRDFLANLIVINDSGFDIVLGMDLLNTSYALIDYKKKKVTFRVLVIQSLNSILGM